MAPSLPLPPGVDEPSSWYQQADTLAVIAVAIVIIVLAIYAAGRRRAMRPPPPPPGLPPPEAKVPAGKAGEAAGALERARVERDEAEKRLAREKADHETREAAARRRLEEEARAREEADRRAAEAKKALETAGEDEKTRARAEADKTAAEAARRRKDEEETRRRAEYEAKKAREAEEKARRRAEQEETRLRELEQARLKAEAEARAAAAEEEKRRRRIEAESGRTLAEGLVRTRGGFMARIAQLVGAASSLDDRFLGELEEILFSADIGVKTATRLLEHVREKLKRRELADPSKVKAALREEIQRILTLEGTFEKGGMPAPAAKPQVVMVVGVNGSGKTTTIGKLAFKERVSGREVLLGAGDTFRAAAMEQLDVWADRAEVELVKGPADSDPAAVCFDTVKKAVDGGRDLVVLDTAGRLHTKTPLMDELKKVQRVVAKAMPGAPHEVWLVVDGTTGQNALAQARQFHETLGLTGLVLTKLDGTARGGVVIGICDELKVPIRYVGVGEKIGDLRAFSPKEFVEALFQEA